MDESLQFFLTQQTNIGLTEIALFIAKHQMETLYLERNSIKQMQPLDEIKFRRNTDLINYCVEAIMIFENILEKQQN